MGFEFIAEESLVQRLPLPLAQLYRRAHNAKTALERHNTAFFLWEASLKLLGAAAVVEYAGQPRYDAALCERLTHLARPALGHWWEFVRRLVPILADQGDAGFASVRDLLLGKSRDDLPRAAGLDAALRGVLDGKMQARITVSLAKLFDRLVRYRNQELGHGASGRRSVEHYLAMGNALLAGVAEVIGRLDCLAGRRFLSIVDVRRQPSGDWLVERWELLGEAGRRIESLMVPEAEAARLPRPERIYLEVQGELRCLHPLLIHDGEHEEVLFLNSRRGRKRTEYLAYTSGRVVDRPDLDGEQRTLLTQVLGTAVDEQQAEAWAAHSQAEEPPERAAAAATNRQLGEFELLSELGRGGMGIVYRAWQPSLGRQVALKRLQKTGDARAETRFAREIQALGRVEHPHLVKIFTSGSEGDEWFYAMELIEGAPLSEVCTRLQNRTASVTDLDLDTWQEAVSSTCEEARKAEKTLGGTPRPDQSPAPPGGGASPLTQDRAAPLTGRSYIRHVAGLLVQVAGAAHALHEAGILHRDIKPGNLMVTTDGSQAVLMDLGLAKLADDIEGRLTRTRQFVGTLRYASPEQLAGARLDRRADVYSIGATLWELLALKPLFGITDHSPTPDAILKVQQAEPDRLRMHHPGLPRDLEAIVHKCLEKSPEQRYATARELGRDLDRFLDGKPVQARPVKGWERGWKWVKRRPALAALSGLLILAILLLIGTLISGIVVTTEALQKAVAAQVDLDVQRAKAQKALLRAESLLYCIQIQEAQRHLNNCDLIQCRALLGDCRQELRGPEFGYLWNQLRAAGRKIEVHTGRVNSLVSSHDNQRLFSASSADTAIKVWDLRADKAICSLDGHEAGVISLALSVDGKRLYSGSRDKTIKVWDAEAGQAIFALRGHNAGVLCLAVNEKGKRLYSGSDDRTIKVWDLDTGKALKTLRGHRQPVTCVALGHDGKRLYSGSQDTTIKVWDLETGNEILTLRGHTAAVNALALRRDEQQLCSGSADTTIKVWDLQAWETATLNGHTKEVLALSMSADGKQLFSGSEDLTIKDWDLKTLKEIRTMSGHRAGVTSLALSNNGQQLFSGSGDTTVVVWALRVEPARTVAGFSQEALSLAVSGGGQRLFAGNFDKNIHVWNLEECREITTLGGHTAGITSLLTAEASKLLFSASYGDSYVKVWNEETYQEIATLGEHKDCVTSLALRKDGKRLFSGSFDRTIRIWDLEDFKVIGTLSGHGKGIQSLALTEDGQWLGSGCADGTIKLWDLAAGKESATLRGHADGVSSLAWSADGKRLFSGSYDKTIKVWDLEAKAAMMTLRGHSAGVTIVRMSVNDQRLFSGSLDKTIKVWDLEAGKETLTLVGHTGGVLGLALSQDGKRLFSASEDRTIKIWDLAPDHGPLLPQGPGN